MLRDCCHSLLPCSRKGLGRSANCSNQEPERLRRRLSADRLHQPLPHCRRLRQRVTRLTLLFQKAAQKYVAHKTTRGNQCEYLCWLNRFREIIFSRKPRTSGCKLRGLAMPAIAPPPRDEEKAAARDREEENTEYAPLCAYLKGMCCQVQPSDYSVRSMSPAGICRSNASNVFHRIPNIQLTMIEKTRPRTHIVTAEEKQ